MRFAETINLTFDCGVIVTSKTLWRFSMDIVAFKKLSNDKQRQVIGEHIDSLRVVFSELAGALDGHEIGKPMHLLVRFLNAGFTHAIY